MLRKSWLAACAYLLLVGTSPSFADDVASKPFPLSVVAPAGAIVLFDGSNLDAWSKQKTKDWEAGDGPAAWKILPDGVLEVVPGANSIITKSKFSDFKLHLEFRLLEPKTNGGVFLLSRYEFGIKDTDGTNEKSPCGSFENLIEPIKPRVNAALPNGQWQSLDVDFRAPRASSDGSPAQNARATVRLNGVTIHENAALGPRKGAAKRLGDATAGPLMLQEHGTAYQFRNIWIVEQK